MPILHISAVKMDFLFIILGGILIILISVSLHKIMFLIGHLMDYLEKVFGIVAMSLAPKVL